MKSITPKVILFCLLPIAWGCESDVDTWDDTEYSTRSGLSISSMMEPPSQAQGIISGSANKEYTDKLKFKVYFTWPEIVFDEMTTDKALVGVSAEQVISKPSNMRLVKEIVPSGRYWRSDDLIHFQLGYYYVVTGHESDTILRIFGDTYKIPNNYYQYMPTSPVVHLSNQ